MKILLLNGSYQAEGTTTQLSRSFMEGAASKGAEPEMIMLKDKKIEVCRNCLGCYAFEGDGAAPCRIKDDMDEIIPKIAEADGVLFASPVHNGFVSGLMTVFWERLSWRAARPSAPVLQINGIASRLTGKTRALGSICSAGGMPARYRKFCDDGTPWLKSNASLLLHGQWIGDMYAAAELERMPQTDRDWRRIYFLRRLGPAQHRQARELGVKMAEAAASGTLEPFTMDKFAHPALKWILERINRLFPPYHTAR